MGSSEAFPSSSPLLGPAKKVLHGFDPPARCLFRAILERFFMHSAIGSFQIEMNQSVWVCYADYWACSSIVIMEYRQGSWVMGRGSKQSCSMGAEQVGGVEQDNDAHER